MEVTDKELLELAAKAAGYNKYYTHYLGRDSFVTYDEIYYSEAKERQVTGKKTMDWNPLADDGDALRLAVALNLTVVFHPALNQALCRPYHTRDMGSESREDAEKHADPYTATRRAIVRAAAAIGQSLPATSSASPVRVSQET